MKFSLRQILASAAGAVLAALIASSFGVTGTIIGVAIGSAAATLGSALVSQSIERGHQAVKQVVVRVPEGSTSTLLRRLGGTGAAGGVTSPADPGAPTEVVAGAGDETTEMESAAASVDETQNLEISAVADAPSTEHLEASTIDVPQPAGGRRFSWPAIAGTAAIVFVLALMFVTAVELIAGQPFASLFGSTATGPSIANIGGSPAKNSTTTTSTSTPASTSTTNTPGSSTTTSTSTTSTTTPSTTGPSGTTTTTSNFGATTTVPQSAATTTSRP
ncbi:MAG TPA: hypothetical protein VG346_14840 [Acidimicrobiales bacterium]|nr:hypothetical protein [Acidimicrobiales bacterium]